mgnify:CR=1 FL=1
MVNAFASSVTARNTVVVHRALAADRGHGGNEVEVVETNRRGHATRFAQDAARRGVDVVIGFGGDGTLNEVATGVAGTDTALGVLPGGSTNVFARTIGMPNDPVLAVEQLAAGIAALTEVLTPDAYEHMAKLGSRLAAGCRDAIAEHGIPANVVDLGCKGCVCARSTGLEMAP